MGDGIIDLAKVYHTVQYIEHKVLLKFQREVTGNPSFVQSPNRIQEKKKLGLS